MRELKEWLQKVKSVNRRLIGRGVCEGELYYNMNSDEGIELGVSKVQGKTKDGESEGEKLEVQEKTKKCIGWSGRKVSRRRERRKENSGCERK